MKILAKLFGIFKSASLLQPVLTIVLIGLIGILIANQGWFSNSSGDENTVKVEFKEVSFDRAVDKYLTSTYRVYARGSIFVKAGTTTVTEEDQQNQNNPTNVPPQSLSEEQVEIDEQDQNPEDTTDSTTDNKEVIEVVEQEYENHFFYIQNGEVKKFEYTAFGDKKGLVAKNRNEVYLVSDSEGAYVACKPNQNQSSSADPITNLCLSTYDVIQDSFPLTQLLKEYKEEKFIPKKIAGNVYQGTWSHPRYTGGEIRDVILSLNSQTELFERFAIVNDFIDRKSELSFEFKEIESIDSILEIPDSYEKLELNSP